MKLKAQTLLEHMLLLSIVIVVVFFTIRLVINTALEAAKAIQQNVEALNKELLEVIESRYP